MTSVQEAVTKLVVDQGLEGVIVWIAKSRFVILVDQDHGGPFDSLTLPKVPRRAAKAGDTIGTFREFREDHNAYHLDINRDSTLFRFFGKLDQIWCKSRVDRRIFDFLWDFITEQC